MQELHKGTIDDHIRHEEGRATECPNTITVKSNVGLFVAMILSHPSLKPYADSGDASSPLFSSIVRQIEIVVHKAIEEGVPIADAIQMVLAPFVDEQNDSLLHQMLTHNNITMLAHANLSVNDVHETSDFRVDGDSLITFNASTNTTIPIAVLRNFSLLLLDQLPSRMELSQLDVRLVQELFEEIPCPYKKMGKPGEQDFVFPDIKDHMLTSAKRALLDVNGELDRRMRDQADEHENMMETLPPGGSLTMNKAVADCRMMQLVAFDMAGRFTAARYAGADATDVCLRTVEAMAQNKGNCLSNLFQRYNLWLRSKGSENIKPLPNPMDRKYQSNAAQFATADGRYTYVGRPQFQLLLQRMIPNLRVRWGAVQQGADFVTGTLSHTYAKITRRVMSPTGLLSIGVGENGESLKPTPITDDMYNLVEAVRRHCKIT